MALFEVKKEIFNFVPLGVTEISKLFFLDMSPDLFINLPITFNTLKLLLRKIYTELLFLL